MVVEWALPLASTNPQGLIYLVDRIARAPLSGILIFAAICTVARCVVHPYLMRVPPHKRGGLFLFARIINEFSDAMVYAAIVVFLLVRPFGIQTFYIPSGSMIDTLRVQDFIVLNKFIYRVQEPKRGDIVVFRAPKDALREDSTETDFIKRLVGVPGDVIEIRGNKLYRNGQPVDEPYVSLTETSISASGFIDSKVLPKELWSEVVLPDFKLVNDSGRFVPVLSLGDEVNNTPGTADAFRVDFGDFASQERLKSLPPAAVPQGYYLFMGDNRNGSFDSRGWGLVSRDAVIGRSEFIWLPVNRWGRTR